MTVHDGAVKHIHDGKPPVCKFRQEGGCGARGAAGAPPLTALPQRGCSGCARRGAPPLTAPAHHPLCAVRRTPPPLCGTRTPPHRARPRSRRLGEARWALCMAPRWQVVCSGRQGFACSGGSSDSSSSSSSDRLGQGGVCPSRSGAGLPLDGRQRWWLQPPGAWSQAAPWLVRPAPCGAGARGGQCLVGCSSAASAAQRVVTGAVRLWRVRVVWRCALLRAGAARVAPASP